MRRATVRVVALLLGVALPTVLLGLGWLLSSVREHQGVEREQRLRLSRSADVVRGAVDESLEELRRREDQRPFYLYNHYYSPPDVLAIADPVAVSPLARAPSDPRIVGYFQVEPDGTVRTPYTPDAETPGPERARRIVERVGSASFEDVRGLARGRTDSLVAAVDVDPTSLVDAGAPEPPSAGGPRPVQSTGPPQGPLTVSLNPWAQAAYEDISAAQQGSAEANQRVVERGRQAPITRRNVIAWDEVQGSPSRAPSAPQGTPGRARRARRQAAREPEPAGPSPIARRTEVEVDYTPMAWRGVGASLVLHRVVEHEGTSVVQGVVLSREHLVDRWIPALVERHAVAEELPRVVTGDGGECVVRRPASAVLEGVDLCYGPAALASVMPGRGDTDLQLGALVGLLVIAGVGVFLVHRAGRREEELSRQKSAFVSAVSHELRTPLTTLRMHAEMLRDGLVSEDKRERFHADLVHESVRLSRLVENVLEISRIEEGRRPLRPTDGDLRDHVAAVVEEQRALIEERGFALSGPSEGEPVELSFDAQAVEQVVTNLLDNAVKYARTPEPRIAVDVSTEPGAVVLTVRDGGPGIPAAERERVFDRFHRVERQATAHMPGTGIGLALVRDLARAHGGEAEVREAPGGGTEVRVELPTK